MDKFWNAGRFDGGLRDAKHVTYEGGQRVPCIMKWPAQIPAGWICNRLTSGIDILPTIAAIVGRETTRNVKLME